MDNVNAWLYTVALIALGIVSVFTREIVTFVMLAFVLIILFNIHRVLKEISGKLDQEKNVREY